MIETKRRKNHKRYIIYRIYVPVIFVCTLIWGFSWFISIIGNGGPSATLMIGFGVIFLLFAIAIFMIMSVFIFPLEFSIFGNLERTSLPDEKPIFQETSSFGGVSSFRATIPFFSWTIYPSGLGISILGIGRVFMPNENIQELIDTKGLGISARRYILTHNSPELRNPVYLPNRKVFEALQASMS